MTTDMFRFSHHKPVRSSFMLYHRACNKSNTTSVTGGAWSIWFHLRFLVGFVLLCIVFCRLWFVLSSFSFGRYILLWSTASDYPFDILRLFVFSLYLLSCVSCMKHNFEILMDSVEDYARQWAKREKEDLYTLSEWVKSVRSLIQIRI
jgi:hypothetical protein